MACADEVKKLAEFKVRATKTFTHNDMDENGIIDFGETFNSVKIINDDTEEGLAFSINNVDNLYFELLPEDEFDEFVNEFTNIGFQYGEDFRFRIIARK